MKEAPFEDLAEAIAVLLQNGEDTAKGIIFCRYYKECSQLYLLHKSKLGVTLTSPVGASDLHQYRRVEMFTRCTETSLKEKIVASFADPASHLQEPLLLAWAWIALCLLCGPLWTFFRH